MFIFQKKDFMLFILYNCILNGFINLCPRPKNNANFTVKEAAIVIYTLVKSLDWFICYLRHLCWC